VALGQFLLNPILARQQPVHGRVQILRAGIGNAELLGQRGRRPPARGCQLDVRGEDARRDHGQHPLSLG